MSAAAFDDQIDSAEATPARILALRGAPGIAKCILGALRGLEGGALLVHTPGGEALRFGDARGPAAELAIRDWRFASRVASGGDIGFAEGWVEGEWTSPDLAGALALLSANAERVMRYFRGGLFVRALARLAQSFRANTKSGSRRNILAHYDLGNAFFEAWLDPSMTYSSARFLHGDDLQSAQQRKYAALAQMLRLKPGDSVLEIGCGWGGFAEYAAREHGARVTAITISDEQFAYARKRIAEAGLAARVEIRRQDYRDVEGRFDAVASVEMIEAVGEAYWPAYFAKIAEVLRPGGQAALQAIVIRDELFESYRRRTDFIQRYIFPGGMLASLAQLRVHSARAGLAWVSAEGFASCYARTLSEWARRFRANWTAIERLGFDERFRRLWLFYLAYCEAGFRTGRTDVVHLGLRRQPAVG
jgi:cyclopropane-fatty-acyl-phospholipid synthase